MTNITINSEHMTNKQLKNVGLLLVKAADLGMILDNAINRDRKLITPNELHKLVESRNDVTVIDARICK